VRLQATQEFYLPCNGSAKVLTFFFVFLTAILVPKKEKKRKCGCLFRPKNKKIRFLAPKNKKKTIFGRPLLEIMQCNLSDIDSLSYCFQFEK